MDNAMRQTAHVILDGLVAFDDERLLADDPNAAEPSRLALERLNNTGAVTVTLDPDGAINVNLNPVLGAASVTIFWLVRELARERGVSPEDVVATVREYLDRSAS